MSRTASSFLQRHRDDHAFTGRQAISLDDDRRAFAAHVGPARSTSVKFSYSAVGMRWRARKSLVESFGRFELRGDLRRASGCQTSGLEGVDHANHQRELPRPDDGQTDVMALGESGQGGDIGGGDRQISPDWPARYGIARRNIRLYPPAETGRLSGQRVFAPAVADNQNVHQELHEWRAPERARGKKLMAEMTHVGEDHRDAVFVGGGDHFVIADRAARLDHAGDADCAAASMPSRNRKKASEAIADPFTSALRRSL